jgi:predicted small metal-binding protein
MRVFDCDECGETFSADDDGELTRLVSKHYSSEHEALDDEELEEKIREGAYNATDS